MIPETITILIEDYSIVEDEKINFLHGQTITILPIANIFKISVISTKLDEN